MRFRRLFETAKDGISVLDADTGKLTDTNPFRAEKPGYSQEGLAGKKLWDLGPTADISRWPATAQCTWITWIDTLLNFLSPVTLNPAGRGSTFACSGDVAERCGLWVRWTNGHAFTSPFRRDELSHCWQGNMHTIRHCIPWRNSSWTKKIGLMPEENYMPEP